MGKIRKAASAKHNTTLSTYVANFIREALDTPVHLLPAHLASFPTSWPFLRGDLYHWITLLNRFDDVLEAFTCEYELQDGPQKQPFTCQLLLSGRPNIQNGTNDATSDVAVPTQAQLAGLGYPQDGDRQLVESIVMFSTLLLDNCANRSLYASSDILNHMLYTESLSLTTVVLTLTLRLAQRYSSSKMHRHNRNNFLETFSLPALSGYYKVNLQRVEQLAQPFIRAPSKPLQHKDHADPATAQSIDLVKLVRTEELPVSDKERLGTLEFSFAKADMEPAQEDDAAPASQIPASPTPERRSQLSSGIPLSGASLSPKYQATEASSSIRLTAQQIATTQFFQLVQATLGKVPESMHYEVFVRIRYARALLGPLHARHQAVQIQLLAIANLANLYTETMLQENVFQHEAEESRRAQAPHQLCNLVHPPGHSGVGVPRRIQVLALNVLESFTNHKTRGSEVAQCLNINVSHGVLTYIMRKVNLELGESSDQTKQHELNEYCDALFALLRSLPNQQLRSREGLVNMGILGMLSDSLKLRTPIAERNHVRAIASIDSLAFSTSNGFQALVDVKGLDVVSDLMIHEVAVACKAIDDGNGYPTEYKSQQTDYQIPFVQQQVLRQLLRHINHMTTSTAGGFERILRNLIEHPPLLSSLKLIVGRPEWFGASIWTWAVEIFANFINQEPTSWTAIGEAGVTKTFLDVISRQQISATGDVELPGMLPTVEAIACVPLAIGALCLNPVGFEQLEQTHALQKFFGIFLSPSHVQALVLTSHSRDAIEGLGAHFDEIARHHPSLRPQIMDAVSALAGKLAAKVYNPDMLQDEGIRLLESSGDSKVDVEPGDVEMHEASIAPAERKASPETFSASPAPKGIEYFAVYIKFLIGFFGNPNLVAAFPEHNDSLERLVDLAIAPSWPGEFMTPADVSVGIKLNELFMNLAETKPHLTLPLLVHRLLSVLRKLNEFSTLDSGSSFFARFVTPHGYDHSTNSQLQDVKGNGTDMLRNLLAVRTLCNLLSKLIPMALSRGQVNCFTAVNLCDLYVEIVERLGQLQRRVIWEDVLLRLKTPSHWTVTPARTTNVSDSANDTDAAAANQTPSRSQGGPPESLDQEHATNVVENRAEKQNMDLIRSVFGSLPITISKLLLGLTKSLLHKRTGSDLFQKQPITAVAQAIAKALAETLSYSIPDTFSEGALDTYRFVAISHSAMVLVEHTDHMPSLDRVPVIHSFVTNVFRKRGGIRVLSTLAQQMFERCIKPGPESELDSRLKLPGAGGKASLEALKMILALFQHLSSHKLVTEAPQSVILNKDREKDRHDHFSTAQFLIELRHDATQAVLPMWNSEALDQASPTLIKLVCSVLKNVLDGEGEHGAVRKSEKLPPRDKSTLRFWRSRHDPDSISRLADGGIDMQLALESLYRCNDSMSQARDYCGARRRSTAFPELRIPLQYLETPVSTASHCNNEPSEGSSSKASLLQESYELDHTLDGQNMSPIVAEDLELLRTDLQSTLMEQCLNVLESFPSLTFELSELIAAGVPSHGRATVQEEAGKTLVMSLVSLQDSDLGRTANQVASYAHLLGILLQEQDFFLATRETLKDAVSNLLSFIKLPQERLPDANSSWISHVLLIIERLLSEDAQPQSISWSPDMSEAQASKVAELGEPLVADQDKDGLFQSLMELLPRIGKDEHLAVSVCRVLVMLTRNRQLAARLGQRRNIQRLFLMARQLMGFIHGKIETAFMLILRHIVEDVESVKTIMKTEICLFMQSHSPTRPVEMATLTRQLYQLVLRQPETFVETCNEILIISKYEKSGGNPVLALKPSAQAHAANDAAETATGATSTSPDAMVADEDAKSLELKPPSVEHPDGAIHFLLSELLTYKDVADRGDTQQSNGDKASDADVATQPKDESLDTASSTQGDPTTMVDRPNAENKSTFVSEDHVHYIYRCFLLKCLAELLESYNRTKIEFINFSRKADPQAATPSKPRSGVLNYFLNSLIPCPGLQHPQDVSTQKLQSTSDWSIRVIAALCARTPENRPISRRESYSVENEPDLLFVRRFVLEHALKAFRDTNASVEPFDTRYAKLMSLADLFNTMLQGRQDGSLRRAPNGAQDNVVPTQKQLAKIMFEKNFITALTQSVADIDLKMSGAHRAVKHILGPLKLLTHTAIELSLSSDLSASPGNTDEDEISSATSLSDADDAREETPDLFRNSTLGMFENDGDDNEDSEGFSVDEDYEMYDEEVYEDGLEYDDEASEHNDEVVSEPDDEMDGVGPIEGLSGDVPMEVQIEIDDEADEDEDDDDDDEDDDDGDSLSQEDDDDQMSGLDSDDDEDMDDDDDEDGLDIIDHLHHGPHGSAFANAIDGWEDDNDEDDDHASEILRAEDLVEDELDGLEYTGADGDVESDAGLEPFRGAGVASLGALNRDQGLDVEIEDEGMGADAESEGDEEAEEDIEEDYDDYPAPGDDEEGGDDTDVPPFVFGWHNGMGGRRPLRQRWTDWDYEMPQDRAIVGGYRSHHGTSPQNGRGEDHTANPLLSRDQSGARRSTNWFSAAIPGTAGAPRPGTDGLAPGPGRMGVMSRLLQVGGADVNPGDEAALANLLTLLGQHRGVNPFTVYPHPSGGLSFSLNTAHGSSHHLAHHHHHHPSIFRDLGLVNGHAHGHRHHHGHPGQSSPLRDASAAVAFETASTIQRWQEEARLLFGPRFAEKCLRVVNSLMRLLVPPAIEAEKLRKQKEEEARRERERQADEKRRKEEAEREEQRRKEEAERAEREARQHADTDSHQQAKTHTEAEAAGHDAMEGVESTAPDLAPADPSTSVQQPRVYVDIRGRPIDITDLGIDLEVLDALPEEMREEVIMQQFQEHRSNLRDAGEEPSDLNPEFLDALPTEIRNELLQQEAADRRRREREEERQRRQQRNGQAQPEDMNPADFMASLDPMLRQSVLAEADEETLSQLPPDLAAEARALGGHHRRALDARIFRSVPDLNASGARARETNEDAVEGRLQRRPIVQMLDRAGIATLLRLMFVSFTGNTRLSLNSILRNACGNRQTRHEILGGLLTILQDGSADVGAVERSFAHLTVRAKQQGSASTQKTPQSSKKPTSALPASKSEASPLTVVSQCLMALEFLTHSVNHVPQFFFSENEAFAVLRSKAARKGKVKDGKAMRYPLNALLSLLERDIVMNNLPVMEQLAALLASVTGPLSNLLRKDKVEDTSNDTSEANAAPTTETRPADSAVGDSVPETDTAMAETSTLAHISENDPEPSGESSGQKDGAKVLKRARTFSPPVIPEENLRLVINLITASESNSKAFRDTLSTMTSLSYIPGARRTLGDELNNQAHLLAQSIRQKLSLLLAGLPSAENEIDAQSLALAIFPSAGSLLIKISRVLAALDYIFDAKVEDGKDAGEKEQAMKILEEGKELLNGLYQDQSFVSLWSQLSDCMATLQTNDRYFFNVATILLPLVEALMIACKRLPSRDTLRSRGDNPANLTGVSNMRTVFFSFTNRHRKILNDLVRHNPKLMSGTFSTLAKNSSVLEFDNKRNFFNRKLHHRAPELRHHHSPTLQLHVRRDQVFLDSYKALYFKSAEEVKYGKFNIRFSGEEGVDAGGVTREWFQVLARQMFNPDYALFNPVASDRTTFHPNSLSSINPEHLQFFKFIGRMIGKALYENRVLDCHFSRAVYKRILGKSVSMKDMETIDLDYTKGMEWILKNDITDVITETFSLEQDSFGVTEIIDLVPNGRNIAVTEDNKDDYVRRVIDYKLTGAVKEQLQSFLDGFHDIVPAELIQIFDEGELELLISGMPDVDIDDWKGNTEYHNYTVASPQVQWFWRAVRSFDKDEVAKLLQFVTGTGKVPLNGFKELEGMNGFTRFSIHKDFGNKDRLPSSHTCFNQLDLPEYDSYDSLRRCLYTAMTSGNEYFGYA